MGAKDRTGDWRLGMLIAAMERHAEVDIYPASAVQGAQMPLVPYRLHVGLGGRQDETAIPS